MTTIKLTLTEVPLWREVPEGGTFWLVREPSYDLRCDNCGGSASLPLERRCENHLAKPTPPAEFVQACAPCETCGNARRRTVRDLSGVETFGVPCPDCRIELVGPCPTCNGGGMIAHCGRTDNGSDGPCVLAPHAENFPCYGDGDVASDGSPVSWCSCGRCSCGSLQAWTEQGPCQYCHEQPTPGTVTLGHAYAVGQPLPIVQVPFLNVRQTPYDFAHGHTGPLLEVTQNGRVLLWTHHDCGFRDVTANLAYYGPPESLVGKWAVELRRA